MRFAIIFLCLLIGRGAIAAPPPATKPAADARPWATGVSQERQDEAIRLFSEGTKLLKDAFFTRAVELYRKALESWDHPAIHFNLAKAYMNLDQQVDAYKHLKLSLKFGGAPLDADQIEQVNRYIEVLYTTELADITVVVEEPGAVVSLDGVELFTGPGKWSGVVKPDRRTILATKDGFQPAQEQPVLKAGEKKTFTLTLLAVESVVKYERKFGNWIPWTVIGAGAVMLGAGGVATWQAQKTFNDYDKEVEACQSQTARPILNDNGQPTGGTIYGCSGEALKALTPTRERAELMNTLGVASFIAGGATLVTGFVLLYVNRERPVTVDAPVSLTPYVSPDGAGLSATVSF